MTRFLYPFRLCIASLAASLVAAPIITYAGDWKHITPENGLVGSAVQFVEELDGAVWVGTLSGLAVFRNGQTSAVVNGEAAWDVAPAGANRYWIGTDNGVLLLEGENTTRHLQGYSVGRLANLGTDQMLAIGDQQAKTVLFRYADGKWDTVEELAYATPSDIFQNGDGTAWVILEANGIVKAQTETEPDKWEKHLEGINVISFCYDQKQQIWCGTWGRGIMLYKAAKWENILEDEDAAITTIKEDGNGHIWAATNANGVWEYDGNEWKNHLREEGIINVLEVPADGRVYVSSQSVCPLRVWTGDTWQTLVTAPTMFRSIAIGPNGKLWAGNTLDALYVQP